MAENNKKIKKPKLPNRPSTKPGARPPSRITRRPLFWILVAIVAVTIFGQISSSSNQFTKINTSDAMAAITRGDVEAATIVDRDQVIRLVLKPGVAVEGATYPTNP